MRSAAVLALLFACHETTAPPQPEQPTIAERAWLMQSLWDDGKSEIAFYDGWSEGETGRRTFSIATQLTKHNFDRAKQTKSSDGVSSFKWTIFFELISGSEQFKHSYVVNLAQLDLSPMKASGNRFDWCSNQYRELAFMPSLEVHALSRSDDYGNSDRIIDYQRLSYPAVAIPLVVRSVDFSRMKQVDFSVIMLDGTYVDAMVEVTGTEKLTTASGEIEAEKIIVHYAHAIESTFGPRADKEIYWRALDPARTLIKLEAINGTYGFALVEAIRAAYWEENIFDRLARVKAHP